MNELILQIIPMGSEQSSRPVPAQVLDLSPAPSTAEQSLLAHGLSSVYDPNQEAEEEQKAVNAADTRAVVALTASPSEVTDNRLGASPQCCLTARAAIHLFVGGTQARVMSAILTNGKSDQLLLQSCGASCHASHSAAVGQRGGQQLWPEVQHLQGNILLTLNVRRWVTTLPGQYCLPMIAAGAS